MFILMLMKHDNSILLHAKLSHFWYNQQFHVDKLSSAHVYLRLPEGGGTWDAIPEDLLTDLAQLTKANSIEGNKKDNITVIYTPWSNLKKDGSMAVGQVSFKDQRKVKRILVPQRENAIVNRLNKTKVENTQPELSQEKEEHLRQNRKKDQAARLERVSFFLFLSFLGSLLSCSIMSCLSCNPSLLGVYRL
jgi:hypothetical protein